MSNEYLKHLEKLYKALSILGYSFDDFEYSKKERIIFQKLVYSLQRSGFTFGYDYNLYINGPYSPGLADDGFFIARNIDKFKNKENEFIFSKSGQEKINEAINFIGDNELKNSDWLETLCTLDYLNNYPTLKGNREKLTNKFKELKLHLFNTERINRAFSKIME